MAMDRCHLVESLDSTDGQPTFISPGIMRAFGITCPGLIEACVLLMPKIGIV